MSSLNISGYDISVPLAVTFSIVYAALFGWAIRNFAVLKLKPIGWMIAYFFLRVAAFITRLIVNTMPSLNPDGTLNTTKKTVYIVDSILYSAGYFLLQNTTLGLLDSLLLRLQHHGSTFALPERAMRWFHIAITAGAVLSIWGGLKLANDPLTHEDMDTSRTYRLIGVAVIAVATICMGGASIQASTANLPYDTAHRSGGRFLAIVCICLLVRVGTSYWFIQNPQRMFDEKVLYGLAIAMEMPAAVLLSITPCLALFMNRAGPPMSETVGMQPYEPYHPVVNQAEGGKAQSCA